MTFVDTGFLFALVSTRDEHPERVVEVFRTFQEARLADRLLTTHHVVTETITLARKIGHQEATRCTMRRPSGAPAEVRAIPLS